MRLFSALVFLAFLGFPARAANRVIDSLVRELSRIKEDTLKAKILADIALTYQELGENDSILKYAGETFKLSKKIVFDEGIYWAYTCKGNVALFEGDYVLARRYFDSSLQAAIRSGRTHCRAGANNSLGGVCYLTRDIPRALQYFETALAEWQKLKAKKEMAGAYANIASIYSETGRSPKALELYHKAARTYMDAGDNFNSAVVNSNIGMLYFDEKKYELALKYLYFSLQFDEETGNLHNKAETYNSIAQVYDKQNAYDTALRYYLLEDSLCKKIRDKAGRARCAYSMGTHYAAQSNYTAAEGQFNTVLKLADETETGHFRAYAYQGLANAAFQQGKYERAGGFYKKALELARNYEMLSLLSNLYLRIAGLDSTNGDYKSAFRNYQQYIFWKDSLTNQEKERKITELSLQYEFSKKEDSLSYIQKLTNEKLQKQTLVAAQQKTARNYLLITMVLLGGASFFAYNNYRTKQKLKLQNLRNKIAADLHDDVGSTLSSISIFSQMARAQSKEVIPMLETIGDSSRKMLDAMADIVWTINPENDHLEKIIMRMRSFAFELLGAKEIEFEFNADDDVSKMKLSMEERKNLYLIFKEATNNMVKYSNADKAMFSVKGEKEKLTMMIRDNGKGFDTEAETTGNGLKNMRRRAAEIGARLIIDSLPGSGTTIKLELPV